MDRWCDEGEVKGGGRYSKYKRTENSFYINKSEALASLFYEYSSEDVHYFLLIKLLFIGFYHVDLLYFRYYSPSYQPQIITGSYLFNVTWNIEAALVKWSYDEVSIIKAGVYREPLCFYCLIRIHYLCMIRTFNINSFSFFIRHNDSTLKEYLLALKLFLLKCWGNKILNFYVWH